MPKTAGDSQCWPHIGLILAAWSFTSVLQHMDMGLGVGFDPDSQNAVAPKN